MDFFESLLPFLLFIGAAILKSRKGLDKKNEESSGKSVSSSTVKKYFEETREILNRQFLDSESKAESKAESKEMEKRIEDKAVKIDSKKNVVFNKREEVKLNPINKNEIGREKKKGFDRVKLMDGIIMAEVLGKPKSLRK